MPPMNASLHTEEPPASSVDKSQPRVQRMFGQIAGRYDLLNRVMTGGLDVLWRRRTVREAPPAAEGPLRGRPILDVCCGTGDLAFEYQRAAAGTGARVIGTDFTPEMLALTEPKQPAASEQRVDYALADTLALPFAEQTFQIVAAAFGLRNVADTRGGLAEMARVLAPGGHVAILECSTPENPLVRRLAPLHTRVVVPVVGQLLNRNASAAYQYLPDSVAEFPSGPALVEMMTGVGFREVRYHPLMLGVVTLYVGRR